MEQRFLVKVLSGPHQGAELGLSSGTISLGSDDTCDVVFADALIAPKHLSIVSENGQLRLIPEKNCAVYINGKIIKGDAQPLQPFEYITIGTTHIVIGPENEPWPPISFSDIPKIKEETPAPGVNESNDIHNVHTVLANTVLNETHTEPTSEFSAHKLFNPRIAIYVAVAIAVAVLILIFSASSTTEEPKPPENLAPSIVVAIQKLDLPSANTFSVSKMDGKYLVIGYVENNEQQQKVQKALRTSYTNQIRLKIYNTERIVADCQDTFKMRGLTTITASAVSGKFNLVKLDGYVQNDDLFRRVKERMIVDVYGLKGFVENVLTTAQVNDIIQKTLSKYNLSPYFRFAVGQSRAVIRGSISQQASDDWEKAKKEIKDALEKWLPVDTNVTLVAPSVLAKRSFFTGAVASITVDGEDANNSVITMRDNQRYSVGSILPSGYKISAIGTTGITFEKGEESTTVKLEEI